MGLYDRPAMSKSSEAIAMLDTLLSLLDASESLQATLRRGETPHSHVWGLLEKAGRRTSSLRNTFVELRNFLETQD